MAELKATKSDYDTVSGKVGTGVMDAMIKLGRAEAAMSVFDKMRSCGLKPDSNAYNIAAQALRNTTVTGSTRKFIEALQQDGMLLSVPMYTSILISGTLYFLTDGSDG
jgi:pentatricopeptide repeat protein